MTETRHHRPNAIVKMIRKSPTGSVNLVLNGETIAVGFDNGGDHAALIMVNGGYYVVRAQDGRKFDIAKGELVAVAVSEAQEG
jgi:hypothetical protein